MISEAKEDKRSFSELMDDICGRSGRVIFQPIEGGWKATLKRNISIYGAGRTKAEALGRMIMKKPSEFHIYYDEEV